jgi:AAA family ATP:ADP antiporter
MTLPDPERDSGMSTLVLGNLPPHQLRIMRFILQKGGEAVYTELAQALAALPEAERLSQSQVDEALEGLSQQQWLIRSEAEPLAYRVNFRRKATRDLSEVIPQRGQPGETKRDIWNVLDTLDTQKDLPKKLDFKDSEKAKDAEPPAASKDSALPPRRPETSRPAHWVNRIFRLRPEETRVVLVLGFLLFGNAVAQQISEITAISNFLSAGGVNKILLVWGVDALLVLLVTGLQSLVIDRFDRLVLIRALLFGLGLAFVGWRLLFAFHAPNWLNYALLYLLSQQQWLFFPLVFWILANDVLDMSQATRLFPLIASLGFAGRLLGIGIAAAAPSLMRTVSGFKPEELLLVNAFIYLIAYMVFSWGLTKVKVRQTVQRQEKVRETLTEGWAFVKEVPAFRYLALVIIAMLICDTVIEFRFLAVSDATFSTPESYQTFYSLYRLGLTLAAFLFQTFFTSRLLSYLQLKRAFFIKPISVLIGALVMMASPLLAAAVAGVLFLRLPQYTVDESAQKAFQALVPEERRGRVSIFRESYLYVVGVLVGCILTGLIVWVGGLVGSQFHYYLYLAIAVVASLGAIWAVFRLRATYDTSLLNWRLKRRQRGKSMLSDIEF